MKFEMDKVFIVGCKGKNYANITSTILNYSIQKLKWINVKM